MHERACNKRAHSVRERNRERHRDIVSSPRDRRTRAGYTCALTHTHKRTHTHTHTQTHTHTHMQTYKSTHKHTDAHIHTNTHTNSNTHTSVCVCVWPLRATHTNAGSSLTNQRSVHPNLNQLTNHTAPAPARFRSHLSAPLTAGAPELSPTWPASEPLGLSTLRVGLEISPSGSSGTVLLAFSLRR